MIVSFLADSNVIIYAISGRDDAAIDFIAETFPSVSVVSKIEVLGYPNLDATQYNDFINFFDTIQVVPINNLVVNKTIEIRRTRKIKLADALIAATAIVHNLTLVTANVEDFKNIQGLSILNIFLS